MVDLLIQNADILQVEAKRAELLSGHDIIVSGKRISAIEPSGTTIMPRLERLRRRENAGNIQTYQP